MVKHNELSQTLGLPFRGDRGCVYAKAKVEALEDKIEESSLRTLENPIALPYVEDCAKSEKERVLRLNYVTLTGQWLTRQWLTRQWLTRKWLTRQWLNARS